LPTSIIKIIKGAARARAGVRLFTVGDSYITQMVAKACHADTIKLMYKKEKLADPVD
jgi:hypothetical protein